MKPGSSSPEELHDKRQALMPGSLGKLYDLLWQDICTLHVRWIEYRALFGTSPDTVELLKKAAGAYFGNQQRQQWESVLLHISRLTDPPMIGKKHNLSLLRLSVAVSDAKTKTQLIALEKELKAKCQFVRDWRNRYIAHKEFSGNIPAQPLAKASRAQVEDALKVIREMMNVVELHYEKSETAFEEVVVGNGGVKALIEVIKLGVIARETEIEKLRTFGRSQH